MASFPKPPDVPDYVAPPPVVYTRYSSFVRGDGSNSHGGIPPALLNQLDDPNPGKVPGYFETGSYTGANGYKTQAEGGHEAKFRTNANFSHFSRDDPVRNYGQPDSSHWHMFFGNRGTNAWSTYHTLRMNPASNAAGGLLNGTAYWLPAFIKTLNGITYAKPIDHTTIYYTLNPISKAIAGHLVPLARGLRYVAGVNMDDPDDLEARAEIAASDGGRDILGFWSNGFVGYDWFNDNGSVLTTEGKSRTKWWVNSDGSDPWGGANNLPGEFVIQINAPRFWDGLNLWSPGGYKHFRYGAEDKPNQGQLFGPQGWWEVPQLQLQVRVSHGGWENDLKYWTLASDDMASMKTQRGFPFRPGESMHMDWMGGWESSTFQDWQRNGLGVEGFEPHEMSDSLISSTHKLIVGSRAPDGRFPQVDLSTRYTSDEFGMVPLPSGPGRGPIVTHHKGA